jgi:hypothetical protein
MFEQDLRKISVCENTIKQFLRLELRWNCSLSNRSLPGQRPAYRANDFRIFGLTEDTYDTEMFRLGSIAFREHAFLFCSVTSLINEMAQLLI